MSRLDGGRAGGKDRTRLRTERRRKPQDDAPDEEAHPPSLYVLRRLSQFALPHWRPIAITFVIVMFQAGLGLLGPWPMKIILDSILTEESLEGTTLYLLIGVTGVIVFAAVFDGFIAYMRARYINLAGRTIVFDLRVALFDHIQRVSLQYHSRRRSGDLMTRITSDVKAMRQVFTGSVVSVLYAVLFIFGMGVLLLWLDWQLALLSMVAAPLMYVLLIRYTSQIRTLSQEERLREGAAASVLHEALGAVRLTRLFNQEDQVREKFEEESYASLESGYEATLAGARFGWAVEVLKAGVTALILGFGVMRVMSGDMTPGGLIVFYTYSRGFYRPLRSTMKQYTKITRVLARAERVVEVLDEKEGVADLPDARPAPPFKGKVQFRGVSFAYEEDNSVLKDVALVIPAGKVTAVVGPTGVGKSTLASLVPRLYDPTSGSVHIDGVDIREYTLRTLRAQIGMVLQESVLFRASVSENISYGKPGATQHEIVAAAKAANAHDFVTSLPDGYDSELGERGETLSGGQRQRISIARAIIRDAPILILDEPLAGLDVESAATVLEALDRLMAGKTVILITHQLSTVERADHVIVLEEGQVVQQGSVAELGSVEGQFRRLLQTEVKDPIATGP